MKISESKRNEEESAARHSLGGKPFWQNKCHFPKYMTMNPNCPAGWSFQCCYRALPFLEIPHRLAEKVADGKDLADIID
jgi:hypothetical protein